MTTAYVYRGVSLIGYHLKCWISIEIELYQCRLNRKETKFYLIYDDSLFAG